MRNEICWDDIPIGKEFAIPYAGLCLLWGVGKRKVRAILHDLSLYDNGDNYILIRSSKNGGGFYKTNDPAELKAYRKECLNKGRSNFAPVKKINRILNALPNDLQASVSNNLKAVRLAAGLKQDDVVAQIRAYDPHIDAPMLSKFENGFCIPTPYQLAALAKIYGVQPRDLMLIDDNALSIYA